MLGRSDPGGRIVPQSSLGASKAIYGSPWMNRGGFDIYEGLLDSTLCALMHGEALALAPYAGDQENRYPNRHERGGTPPRRFLSCPGGSAQDGLYLSTEMRNFLSQATGFPIRPSGQRGTYSYYMRPGDYLGLHRDIETCDVAVISAVHVDPIDEIDGGALVLYPGRWTESLSAIRHDPEPGAVQVQLRPSQTIVMLGGLLPHAVRPVVTGQARIISVLCYQIAL